MAKVRMIAKEKTDVDGRNAEFNIEMKRKKAEKFDIGRKKAKGRMNEKKKAEGRVDRKREEVERNDIGRRKAERRQNL